MHFRIQLNAATNGHAEKLIALGYSVDKVEGEKGTTLLITAEGVAESDEAVDATSPEALQASCAEIVSAKKLWTYGTKFRITKKNGDEAVVNGPVACNCLERLVDGASCLIAKPEKAARPFRGIRGLPDSVGLLMSRGFNTLCPG